MIDAENGDIFDANVSAQHFYGYNHSQFCKMNILDISTLPKETVIKNLKAASNNIITNAEFKHKLCNGSIKDIKAHTSSIEIAKKKNIIAIIEDITELKQKQQESQRFNQIIGNALAYVSIANMNKEIYYLNKSMRKAFDVPDNADLSRYHVSDFYSEKGKEKNKGFITDFFRDGYWKGENEMRSLDGRIIQVIQTIVLIKDQFGNPQFTASTAIDITEKKRMEAEKISQLLHYKMLMQISQDAIHILDENGKLLEWNQAFREHLGYSEEELAGLHVWDWDSKLNEDEIKKKLSQITEAGTSLETSHLLKDGSIRNMDIKLHKFIENNKEFYYASARDITEKKQQEELLRISESKMRAILDHSFDAIGLHYNGIWEICNPAALRLFGYTTDEELIGTSILKVIAASEQERIKDFIVKRMNNQEAPTNYITRGLRSNGTEFDLEVSLSDFFQGNKKHVIVILRDVTSHITHENEMLRLNNELRELTKHLETIREEERSSIAKEIHDTLSQNLVALTMNATYLKNKIKGLDKSDKKIFDEQIEIANGLIASSRTLFNSLHPSMLDELGLEAAIKWYAKTKLKFSDITLEFKTNAVIENGEKSIDANLVFFRIFQEGLTNILRYSKATAVSVELNKSAESFSMQISDNGIGFDIKGFDTLQHHGLIGMRERMKAINGKFTINSIIGEGTILKVEAPI